MSAIERQTATAVGGTGHAIQVGARRTLVGDIANVPSRASELLDSGGWDISHKRSDRGRRYGGYRCGGHRSAVIERRLDLAVGGAGEWATRSRWADSRGVAGREGGSARSAVEV